MTIRPTFSFVFGHPAHWLAFGFGTGLARFAPGTFGTLVAFPLFYLLQPQLSVTGFFVLLVAMFVVGIWACDKTGRDLGVSDHGGMVWDEIVAMMLVLFIAPDGWLWQAFAFLGFRFFDIVKPAPIRHFDRTMKGGFGVMFDDIIAAFYTLLVLAAWKALFG